MKLTTFDEFVDLAKRGTFVPVYKEIVADLLTPVSAFLKIAEHSDYAFLLESVEGGEQVGRYSFLGKDPFLVLRVARRQDGRSSAPATSEESAERFMPTVRELMAGLPLAVRARPAALHRRRRRLPRLRRGGVVRAGAVGARAARRPSTATTWPSFMLFDTVLAFDHVQHRILLIANARITGDDDLEALYQFACARIEFVEARARAHAVGRHVAGRRRR